MFVSPYCTSWRSGVTIRAISLMTDIVTWDACSKLWKAFGQPGEQNVHRDQDMSGIRDLVTHHYRDTLS